jgi:chromosome segregation ATPase
MLSESSKGKTGVESIRLNGTIISRLPIAEAVNAAAQIPLAKDAEKQNEIEAVLSRYPKQDSGYIQSRIKESTENIARITKMRSDQQVMINEYSNIVNMCKIRAKELSFYPDDNEERKAKIREWNMTLANANTAAYMVYEDIEPFELQIEQCKDAIVKADQVLERERDDIRTMEQLIGELKARDSELKRLGVYRGK